MGSIVRLDAGPPLDHAQLAVRLAGRQPRQRYRPRPVVRPLAAADRWAVLFASIHIRIDSIAQKEDLHLRNGFISDPLPVAFGHVFAGLVRIGRLSAISGLRGACDCHYFAARLESPGGSIGLIRRFEAQDICRRFDGSGDDLLHALCRYLALYP